MKLTGKNTELKLIWRSDLSEPTWSVQGLTPETLPLKSLRQEEVLWVSGQSGLLNKSLLNKTKQPERQLKSEPTNVLSSQLSSHLGFGFWFKLKCPNLLPIPILIQKLILVLKKNSRIISLSSELNSWTKFYLQMNTNSLNLLDNVSHSCKCKVIWIHFSCRLRVIFQINICEGHY